MLPDDIFNIVTEVKKQVDIPIGIHTHNDSDMAVANSIMAVKAGAVHIQGTINGYGERCGNANLCSIIPNLELKLGYKCLPENKLQYLTETSLYIDEVANITPRENQPYVGRSAFAHKGGMHGHAVSKNPVTYEHIDPILVGNKREILISELSGLSNIVSKANEYGIKLEKDSPITKHILAKIKDLENKGYQFEGAEGSFELIIRKSIGDYKKFFDLQGFRVIVEKREGNDMISEATIKVKVNKEFEHTAAEGSGPVNALDNAIRKALEDFYPCLKEMHLTDFKVRVLEEKEGTAAKVRVLIESMDNEEIWSTVGVSENIIEASWEALVDSIEYKLLKEERKRGEGK